MIQLVRFVRTRIDTAVSSMGTLDTRDLAALLTIAALYFIAHTTTMLVFVTIVAVPTFLFQRVRRGPWVWFAIAATWTPQLILNWQHQEDHTYLAVYWCLAMGLAFMGRRPIAALAINGRILIGLVFAFAVMWKIITPAFVDGSLFHYKLLFDYRFRDTVTTSVGRLSAHETQFNLASISALQDPASHADRAAVHYPRSVSWLAYAMTWATIAGELALAIVFLARRRWLRRMRNIALCLFMLSTYTLVPVLGFGMLFASLGVAQTRRREKGARFAYLATAFFIAVWFYR